MVSISGKKTINGQAKDIDLAVVPFFIGTLGVGEP
jgi:hypothetical protein